MPSFLAGLSRGGRILVINRAVHSSSYKIEYSPQPQEKNRKNTTFEYVIRNDILVSQMCKKQNFHLSLLTMQQQYNYCVQSKIFKLFYRLLGEV